MGLHVIHTGRGAAKVRYFLHPGEKRRPTRLRPGKGTQRPSTSTKSVARGAAAGTRGDFGADFE